MLKAARRRAIADVTVDFGKQKSSSPSGRAHHLAEKRGLILRLLVEHGRRGCLARTRSWSAWGYEVSLHACHRHMVVRLRQTGFEPDPERPRVSAHRCGAGLSLFPRWRRMSDLRSIRPELRGPVRQRLGSLHVPNPTAVEFARISGGPIPCAHWERADACGAPRCPSITHCPSAKRPLHFCGCHSFCHHSQRSGRAIPGNICCVRSNLVAEHLPHRRKVRQCFTWAAARLRIFSPSSARGRLGDRLLPATSNFCPGRVGVEVDPA